jgi:hypothetical protein
MTTYISANSSNHQNGGASSTTVAVTLPGTVGSGHTLCVGVQSANNSGIVQPYHCNDDKSNIYTHVLDIYTIGSGFQVSIFFCTNITNAPQTITGDFNGNSFTFASIIVDEFSGIVTSLPLDGSNGQIANSGTSTDGLTTGTWTTSANGDLIWGYCGDLTGGATFSAGTGFTIAQNVAVDFRSEYLIQSSASASTAVTFTSNINVSAFAVGLALMSLPTGLPPSSGWAEVQW